MDQNENKSINKFTNPEFNEEEINLSEIYKALLRNKKFIFILSFMGFILGSIFAFSTKKTWQGEFQIVLGEEQKQVSNYGKIKELESLVSNQVSRSSKLKTEVGILKSPFVLMDIFNYVKEEKLSRDNKSFKRLRFKDWRKSFLEINLQKGTSILNISYKDTDKDLIIPVLTKISNSYQAYSTKKRLRLIELGENFFNEQIKFYEDKIFTSQQALEEYGNKHNLSVINFGDKSEINVVRIRQKIELLDQNLIEARSIYTENDPVIQRKLIKRKILSDLAYRAPGILIKYRQLLDAVARDRKTLLKLENNLRIANLEKARIEDPWKLLTKPTLLPNYVSPVKKVYALIGGSIGLLISIISSLIFEKRKGIIYSSNKVQSLTGLPLISELSLMNNMEWEETFFYIVKNIISNSNGKIGLLTTYDLNKSTLTKLKKILKKFIENKEVIITQDIKDTDQCKNSILIADLGSTKKDTFMDIKARNTFNKNGLIGIITFNNLLS